MPPFPENLRPAAAAFAAHLRGLAEEGATGVDIPRQTLLRLAAAAGGAIPVRASAPTSAPRLEIRRPGITASPVAPIAPIAPIAPVPVPVPAPIQSPPNEPTDDASLALAALRARLEADEGIRALVGQNFNSTLVFSIGNPAARLMLVGEGPGQQEEIEVEPFVGPAGQLLNRMLKAMGLRREDVYISNVVKFRPKMIGGGPSQNRPPTPEEMIPFRPYLMEEIKIVAPEAIVALGGTAATGLLQVKSSVSSLRGRFHDLGGVPVMPTFHPSYLLRNESLAEKRKVWEDLLQVMERLDMPISPKQRGYFLEKE